MSKLPYRRTTKGLEPLEGRRQTAGPAARNLRDQLLVETASIPTPQPTRPQSRPRSGKIKTAVERYGIGRSSLYGLAPKHPGLFKKLGASTILDFDILDAIVDSLPDADIKG